MEALPAGVPEALIFITTALVLIALNRSRKEGAGAQALETISAIALKQQGSLETLQKQAGEQARQQGRLESKILSLERVVNAGRAHAQRLREELEGTTRRISLLEAERDALQAQMEAMGRQHQEEIRQIMQEKRDVIERLQLRVTELEMQLTKVQQQNGGM